MTHRSGIAKTTVGWREYVDFPEWGIYGLRAKVDTGARTSSLHVEDVKLLENDRIRFYVVESEKGKVRRKKVVAGIMRKGKVRSSTGHNTHRWYVKTIMKIGEHEREIVLNLTDRKGMNFRMLVGRTAIEEAFLVDAGRSFLTGRRERKRH